MDRWGHCHWDGRNVRFRVPAEPHHLRVGELVARLRFAFDGQWIVAIQAPFVQIEHRQPGIGQRCRMEGPSPTSCVFPALLYRKIQDLPPVRLTCR